MKHPEYFYLGKIVRTHGVKGDVMVLLDTDSPGRYKKLKHVFIETAGRLKEYSISKVSLRESDLTATIHIGGIEDMNAAELLLKHELYLPLTELPELKGKKYYFHEIIGFEVVTEEDGNIGKLENILDLPQHPVGEIIFNGKPFLFPLQEDFIEEIDRKNKVLKMRFPEGLLDIYR